ncbi:MAG TPA: DUF4153 domain-containing protein [Pedomonas sp.]|uniref:DUF4153 domain-containing protein n=1 Tax=Pedomonas sp. TaxID=2976421 RepID=UPI002F40C96E
MTMHTAPSGSAGSLPTAEIPWPLRAWALPVLGCLVGLAVHLLTRLDASPASDGSAAVRWALATFLFVVGIVYGFVVERGRLSSSLVFSVAAGAIIACATYWNGPFDTVAYDEPWRIVCAALAVTLAAPLFQAWCDRRAGEALSYYNVHNRAWMNVILWCAAWVFVGIVWLMAFLLAALFELIGIDLLSDLLDKTWAAYVLTGAAFGAAAGVLRDREPVLHLIQRVVTTILSVLAPVLAIGLILFLSSLPFTGLAPLWEATKSTTPILLSCVIGAFSLINAVIGAGPAHEGRHTALRASTIALSVAILPLGVISAVSTLARINQHGLTPDRLWAIVFIGIACVYGIAYLVAVIRRRMEPAALLRSANLKLAFALCGLVLVLSTPLINFSALSAGNQLKRLTSGGVSPDEFDWQALRFDFGPAGIRALETLAREGATPVIRDSAAHALRQETRWRTFEPSRPAIKEEDLTVLPKGSELPADFKKQLTSHDACGLNAPCVVLHEAGSREAIVVTLHTVNMWRQDGGIWRNVTYDTRDPEALAASTQQQAAALKAGQVEIRPVARRQVYVGGQPVGPPFE